MADIDKIQPFGSSIQYDITAIRAKNHGDHTEIASDLNTDNWTHANGALYNYGMYMTGNYQDAATPVSYGNIINIMGRGCGQLLCEWTSSANTGHLFYRDQRDCKGSGDWHTWKKIAFIDDNVASATTAGTCTGNAATATKISSTPNNTTTFLRGDNTWSNTLTSGLTVDTITVSNKTATPHLNMSRTGGHDSPNYITVPASSSLAISVGAANGSSIVAMAESTGLVPYTNNTLSVGTSTYKWANMYATTFHGTLDGNASTATNADKVDNYHAADLWRKDGGIWNPGANITLGATANSQEWSFDITRNGYTGTMWHVWDSEKHSMLQVTPDDGKVKAPYGFVGDLTGNAATATKLTSSAGSIDQPVYFSDGIPALVTKPIKPIKYQFVNGYANNTWIKLFSLSYNSYNVVEVDFVTYHGYDGNHRHKIRFRFTPNGFLADNVDSYILTYEGMVPNQLVVTKDNDTTASIWIKGLGAASRWGYEILNVSDESRVFYDGSNFTNKWTFPTTFETSTEAPTNAITRVRRFVYASEAISNITRSGTTFTATRADGTTFTFTQQDNNSLTGVKGNAETNYRTGNVNLTPTNILGTGTTGQFWRGDNTWSNILTGQLYINYEQDVGLNQNGSLIIGDKSGANIAIDSNEIMARNNSATSSLYIQNEGGETVFGGHVNPNGNQNKNLGTSTNIWNNIAARATAIRHIDAGYANQHNDSALYIGYGSMAPTKQILMFYSADTSSRTQYFTINSNGAYANTRFGVNGQNTSYTLYNNGTMYNNGTLTVNTTAYIPYVYGIRETFRHLDAAKNNQNTDHNLYIGYGADTFTKKTLFYYSTGTTDTTSSRTQFAEINSDGLYALTRFGVNGQNTSYNLYINGTSYHNGNDTHAGNILPETNKTRDLGASSYQWNNVYSKILVNNIQKHEAYAISNPDGAAYWVFLGTLVSMGNASVTTIDMYTGNGYNAQSSQNTQVTIFIKDGWQSTNAAASSFGISYLIKYSADHYSNIQVMCRAIAHDTLNVYVYVPWRHTGHYTIDGYYSSWTHDGSCLTEEPTEGEIQQVALGNLMATNFYGALKGNADTATALTSSAGSSTVPIYFSGGKPVQCSTTLGVSITGNAATATTLQTARAIKIGNKSNNFNGSTDITYTMRDMQVGSQYNVGSTSSNTYILVDINPKSAWMLNFTLKVYSSYTATDFQISGYNYGTNNWYSPQAVILGSTTTGARTVYFGYRNDAVNNYKTLWVAVQGGNYNGACVCNVCNGYEQIDLENAFTVSKVDSLPGTTQTTVTCYREWHRGESVTGAVWNDYAEYREAETIEPGYILCEKGDGSLCKSTKRCQEFAGISSDTWGFAQGETERAKTPIAVSGRVLVYVKDKVKVNDYICSGPDGIGLKMHWWEKILYPHRIVGIVSEIPTYEKWGGGEAADRPPVDVNGRIWIKCCN